MTEMVALKLVQNLAEAIVEQTVDHQTTQHDQVDADNSSPEKATVEASNTSLEAVN